MLGMVFNSSRRPFADKTVRLALNFAVDRQAILSQVLKSRGVIAHGPVWPLHWAYDPTVPGYTYDPVRAAAILDVAFGRSRTKTVQVPSQVPSRFHFTCLLPENFPLWERMALLVQKELFDVGIDMKLESLPAQEFTRRIGSGDFEAVFMEFIGGPSISRPYVFWHSASSRNFSGYHDPVVDQALDTVRRAPDDETYRTGVRALQQGMIADPPGIFLAWGQTARAVSRRFQVAATPNGDILGSVRSWRLASSPVAATQ
jgi:peptide/nickel transport system substrate-binding protein